MLKECPKECPNPNPNPNHKVLKECCSARAQQAGKRALLFFYEGDEACADELAALDEVGGELFLRGCASTPAPAAALSRPRQIP